MCDQARREEIFERGVGIVMPEPINAPPGLDDHQAGRQRGAWLVREAVRHQRHAMPGHDRVSRQLEDEPLRARQFLDLRIEKCEMQVALS